MSVTLDLFRNEKEFQAVPAGTTVFATGDPGETLYVVLEGRVDVIIHGKTVDTLGEGEVFGEMALIDNSPRVATAVTVTDCKLVPISRKRFLFMVQQTPHFSLQIMRVIADRLRKMDARL